jgi:hypothetical protein
MERKNPGQECDVVTFLDSQANQSKFAIREILADMRRDLRSAADIPAWTRDYPWSVVAVGSVFGFVVCSTALGASPRSENVNTGSEISSRAPIRRTETKDSGPSRSRRLIGLIAAGGGQLLRLLWNDPSTWTPPWGRIGGASKRSRLERRGVSRSARGDDRCPVSDCPPEPSS